MKDKRMKDLLHSFIRRQWFNGSLMDFNGEIWFIKTQWFNGFLMDFIWRNNAKLMDN